LRDVATQQLRDEVLTEHADSASLDGLPGVAVPVTHDPRNATEEVARNHPSAVVGDATHLDGGRVPTHGLEHVDVVEEEVHRHGSHGRPDSVTCGRPPCAPAAMGV
jgi:hypothetical protein